MNLSSKFVITGILITTLVFYFRYKVLLHKRISKKIEKYDYLIGSDIIKIEMGLNQIIKYYDLAYDLTVQQHEFYVIIKNAYEKLKNGKLIINNTYDIYKRLYNKEKKLKKYIKSQTDYSMLVHCIVQLIIYNRNKNSILDLSINFKYSDRKNNNCINNAVDTLASTLKKYSLSIVRISVIHAITKNARRIGLNRVLKYLSNIDKYMNFYKEKLEYYLIIKRKSNYLAGNFEDISKKIIKDINQYDVQNGYQFEEYLERLFKLLNYKVRHLGGSGDQGADLIVKKNHLTYVIQAKFYSDNVGNRSVQEIVAAISYYGAHHGIVITNSKFTKSAIELAKANHVTLINGLGLERLKDCIFQDPNEDFFTMYTKNV